MLTAQKTARWSGQCQGPGLSVQSTRCTALGRKGRKSELLRRAGSGCLGAGRPSCGEDLNWGGRFGDVEKSRDTDQRVRLSVQGCQFWFLEGLRWLQTQKAHGSSVVFAT